MSNLIADHTADGLKEESCPNHFPKKWNGIRQVIGKDGRWEGERLNDGRVGSQVTSFIGLTIIIMMIKNEDRWMK